jgi:hypothetical protein
MHTKCMRTYKHVTVHVSICKKHLTQNLKESAVLPSRRHCRC